MGEGVRLRDVAALADAVKARSAASVASRFIVAIAGPPGAGKSSLTEPLVARLSALGLPAAIVPMDGFHYDNAVLSARGQLARKGAPFTFDVGGYQALIQRLKADLGAEIAIPLFDRALDIARAGAALVTPQHRIILTEGNYLLLDEAPWRDLSSLFDMSVMIEVSHGEIERRLVQRWRDHGLDMAAAEKRARENDMVNADLVAKRSRPADFVYEGLASI